MRYLLLCSTIILHSWVGLVSAAAQAVGVGSVVGMPQEKHAAQIELWLEAMTLEEKVSLLSGDDWWSTKAIERLGIPSISVTDGPNGVRSNNSDPTTLFPVGVVMAATWNTDLIEKVGAAIGREANAIGASVLLAPNINIQRHPLAGRNFETFSEDPLLTGEMGAGYVRGVQGEGIGTSLKHYIANNQEHARMYGSSNVDQRTFREIYMPGFKKVITETQPWTVMAAYNKVNGTYMTQHKGLLTDVLRDEWGFKGLVVSDWGALHGSTNALQAGLDLEMPGPGKEYDAKLITAIKSGELSQEDLDSSVRRVLSLVLKGSNIDRSRGELNTPAHQQLSQRVADEAITLLKNERNLLPLNAAKLKRIAVIGPNADAAVIQGGGSSLVVPYRQVTPLEGIKALVGDQVHIDYVQGVDNEPEPATMNARVLSPDLQRSQIGLQMNYYDNPEFTGDPVVTRVDRNFSKLGFADELPKAQRNNFSARWQGYFWPPISGTYEFEAVHLGKAELIIDGKPVITDKSERIETSFLQFLHLQAYTGSIELEQGKAYPIQLQYASGSSPLPMNLLRIAMRKPAGKIADAVQIAKQADAAIIFAGVSTTSESEGKDRVDLNLYGEQNALIEAVLKANPNTIVVLNNGAPLAMPWVDKVHSLVEAWLPGQEGGTAIANVLFGATNPSGKLPVTFPVRIEDNPTYLSYPGNPDVNYGEGVFVGYRYYDKKKIEPLFAFGHGLSYTKFEYAPIKLIADQLSLTANTGNLASEEPSLTLSLDVTNTGDREGKEIVQIYVEDLQSRVPRPIRELKSFQKVNLQPGETKTLEFTLQKSDFSWFDVQTSSWLAESGRFKIHAASSSRDIRQVLTYDLKKEYVSKVISDK